MARKNLQQEVEGVFEGVFKETPLLQRLDDIDRQTGRLVRYSTMKHLRETTGNTLASLMQLCNEADWDVSTLVREALERIQDRRAQYESLGRKTRVAVLGLAGNPITIGHVQLAQYVLDVSNYFDEVWFLPCFGHMFGKDMVSVEHRLAMCRLATQNDGRLKVCDYEIAHELKGETYHTVKLLLEDPDLQNYEFGWIIGMDNANTCEKKWVNWELLERMIPFVVTPRGGYDIDPSVDWYRKRPHIFLGRSERPIIEISSTEVRKHLVGYYKSFNQGVKTPGNEWLAWLRQYLDSEVLQYILDNRLYHPAAPA